MCIYRVVVRSVGSCYVYTVTHIQTARAEVGHAPYFGTRSSLLVATNIELHAKILYLLISLLQVTMLLIGESMHIQWWQCLFFMPENDVNS